MPATAPAIQLTTPRQTVQATFPNDVVLEAPVGTTVEALILAWIELAPVTPQSRYLCAVVDGRLRELGFPITRDVTIQPMSAASGDSRRVYRRTLVLLLLTALRELWPGARVSVSYAVPDGGYYCLPQGRAAYSDAELALLEDRMHEIVAADDPITKQVITLDQATALYRERGDENKLRLLESRTRGELNLYTLRGYADYYFGYMLPSTRYLTLFRLVNTQSGGFILQYPRSDTPDRLAESVDNEGKICQVFEATESLLKRLDLEDIGKLNAAVRSKHVQELILVSEAIHEQQIAQIAAEIYEARQRRNLRLVLIAGPSSSGKTTFSKRLAIQLLAQGLRPFTLEMDNYFVDREQTPRDADGKYDFEALEAINLPLFNEQLVSLITGNVVDLPRFDFHGGRSVPGKRTRLSDNQILIVEGIHGINPRLVYDVPEERIFRVYVSALTQLNLDDHNRIPTTDVRLLRRISRDAVQRGHTATSTINQWPSVRRGEKRNIFPYQENADAILNSTLNYELAALKPIVEPLLLQVEPGTQAHIEANRLLSFLRWVQPMDAAQLALIPDTSLLREFIGGSILADYQPGTLLDVPIETA
jgi:uridine kinase